MSRGIGGHQRAYEGRTDEWLTPPEIISRLGEFCLDPCSPITPPWKTAKKTHNLLDNGLLQKWVGRVWLNPPYGPDTGTWLEKLADHGNGIALVFARTETEMFHKFVWDRADAMLFLRGRLYFHDVLGVRAKANAGGPSVLVAYGDRNVVALMECGIPGKLVYLR